MELKKFLRNYYLTSFFYDFIFAYAVYNLLFNLRGLSVFQISLLLAWWSLTAIVFEIPTGALADSWSRKKMMVLAPVFKTICFVIWFFAGGNFYLYAFGFLFWSLGSAFVSGTTEALLYDTLKSLDKTEDYEKVLGRKKFYFNIALAVSMITGGFIAGYNIDLTVILSVVPLALSTFFALKLQEPPKAQSTGEIHYLEYIKIAVNEIKTNKILFYLFVYLFAISIFGNLEEFDQLYYQLAGLPIFAFGIVGFLWSILNAFGSNFAHKLKDKTLYYYLLPVIASFFLIVVFKFPSIPAIGILLLSYFLTTPLKVLVEAKVQNNISSISRATVTSASSLLVNVFGIGATLLFGLISKYFGLPSIYLASGLFLIIFSAWVFINRKNFGLI